ncbi:hypothetical protein A2291_06695 [candidate division WOR-1 bacterium RIFOXYB2_FULL_42_35]|uniref:Uncharacterized protein n=1 Tax=candidate division WOR-1 bacterium RIFOXYC2_FULL_41_25 TaxID=1802586 RepID=A0A1F4TPG9_UNCSA|nr:MAG: hypothetical protein A2291_06695 [candidate division WOR-1 bacterium RIFOXYB2_FULL_42_35]OGC24569.1 MAG: hypothetical protein A2247_06475 [candidate division WOR-1 bacterium RIFOXYA2_FULL_41_14]OGC34614.1 MAG: hypothetical protein A2462_04710 [candidate division WOR-1 bacterium RIFOXYC2_FULL_41_25]OGC43978.1 MAG: hypothetical protein A2548_06250 [candidate division WOR-1 bacterium RIFOXYD2_FULL_41_8]
MKYEIPRLVLFNILDQGVGACISGSGASTPGMECDLGSDPGLQNCGGGSSNFRCYDGSGPGEDNCYLGGNTGVQTRCGSGNSAA